MFFQKAVTLLYLAYVVQGQKAFTLETVCVISDTHIGDFNGDIGTATLCENHSVTGTNCDVELKYLYTITNVASSVIRAQGISVPDDGDNQVVELDQTPIIKDAKVFAHHKVTKNLCDLSGQEISQLAVAVASYIEFNYGQDSLDDAGEVAPYVTSINTFRASVNNLAPLEWEMSQYSSGTVVKCIVDDRMGQTCEEYVAMIEDDNMRNTRDQCIQDVTFQYKYRITGTSCHTITSLKSKLDGRSFVQGYNKYHSLDGNISCDDRTYCPGDEVEVNDKRTVDFCANNGRTVYFVGTINEITAEQNNVSQKAPWKFPPMVLPVPDSPPTMSPAPRPTKTPTDVEREECNGHPGEMYFQYLGPEYTCDTSDNGSTKITSQNYYGSNRGKGAARKLQVNESNIAGRGKGAGKGAGSTGGKKKPKKGKGSKEFVCLDDFTITDPTPKISVSDSNGRIYFRSSDNKPISVGDCLTASPDNAVSGKAVKTVPNKRRSKDKVPATTVVRIKNQDGAMDENGNVKDQLAQTFSFHSSCSTPFFTGDTYGALKLIGWKSRSGNLFGTKCLTS